MKIIVASRSWPRTGKNDKNRRQQLEVRGGLCNTLTGVQKDNLVLEVCRVTKSSTK